MGRCECTGAGECQDQSAIVGDRVYSLVAVYLFDLDLYVPPSHSHSVPRSCYYIPTAQQLETGLFSRALLNAAPGKV